MKMDTSIRVKTERRFIPLYNDLGNVVGSDSHELFFICACLGYCRKKAKKLERIVDRFWSATILPDEWYCYYAMILEEGAGDLAVLNDDKKVISRVEEYANAGMEMLLEECLDDYVVDTPEGVGVDRSVVKELPRAVLNYIFEQSDLSSQERQP